MGNLYVIDYFVKRITIFKDFLGLEDILWENWNINSFKYFNIIVNWIFLIKL